MNPYEPPQIEPPKVPDFKWSRVVIGLIVFFGVLMLIGTIIGLIGYVEMKLKLN